MIGLMTWRAEISPLTPFDKLMTGFDRPVLSVAEGLGANGKILPVPSREVMVDFVLSSEGEAVRFDEAAINAEAIAEVRLSAVQIGCPVD